MWGCELSTQYLMQQVGADFLLNVSSGPVSRGEELHLIYFGSRWLHILASSPPRRI